MENWKRLLFGFSGILVTLSLVAFLIYFDLANKPVKPNFALAKITINKLNISGTLLVNSKVKIDLLSINPNSKADINFERFHIYAAYHNYPITSESIVLPYEQGEGTNILSYTLSGNDMILPASVCDDLNRAHTNGSLSLTITAVGELRMKIAAWKSSRFKFVVICDGVTLPNCTTFL